ncbi:hypothetical protein FHS56_001419 [Thermonema lapsum]|uniref:CRISPR-associated protein Cas7 n=1 Tax=Thermonema lapsum TaxID=28195 RepID=A0A846MQR5_9BACT|nr:CRISPR-associated protein Cas7 [Thermonema lapsum]NIK73906.1 hypothetical protein [Thermonema lapsum]
MSNNLYVRTLKKVDYTVFAVDGGQKKYYDPIFDRSLPYSSGQQVKRCIIEAMMHKLNQLPAPTTFVFNVNKQGALAEGEVYTECDPSYIDLLVGGWMHASSGGKERTLKRRSPLSISAMRPLHPSLAGIVKENATFDRSNSPNTKVEVKDAQGKPLSPEEIKELLKGKDRSLYRKWIPDQTRATGLFVQDLAIDMDRLFLVTLNPFEPEISDETAEKLRQNGWQEKTSRYYGQVLVVPEEMKQQIVDALADAIVNWQITSNQSRTFDPMTTLAIAISENAHYIANAIRCKPNEENPDKMIPVIDEQTPEVELYIMPVAEEFTDVNKTNHRALEEAKQQIKNRLLQYKPQHLVE